MVGAVDRASLSTKVESSDRCLVRKLVRKFKLEFKLETDKFSVELGKQTS